MCFSIFIAIWLPLFFISYICMRWRQKVMGLQYDSHEMDPALLASLIVPPFAMVFALADIISFKLGFRQKGDHAV